MNVEEKAAVTDDAINSQSFYLLELHYSLDFTDSLNFDFDLTNHELHNFDVSQILTFVREI